jgi:hypothetical protein
MRIIAASIIWNSLRSPAIHDQIMMPTTATGKVLNMILPMIGSVET